MIKTKDIKALGQMSNEEMIKRWNGHWRRIPDVGITPTRLNIFRLFRDIGLPKDAKILDVGCGSGTLAYFWHKRGYDIKAVDFSEEALMIAKKKGIRCIYANATEALPFANDTFDLVYSDGLLEHFIEPALILRELWRVSRRYVLTLVPRCAFYNILHNIAFKPPKEYKRTDNEWALIHAAFNPSHIEIKKVKFGILWLLCQKGKP